MQRGIVVALVAGLWLGGCATSSGFRLSGADQERASRQYVGRDFALGASLWFTEFFGDTERLFADPRPFETIALVAFDGTPVPIGVPSEAVIPAGTMVKVRELVFPIDPLMAKLGAAPSTTTPTGHPYLVVDRTGEGASPLPLVLVLPREISSYAQLNAAVEGVLKSEQWVTSWLTQRTATELDAIFRKQPVEGMSWPGLLAALGEPRNIADRARGELIDFVADYGDLQITLQGNVVKKVVSRKQEAAEAQRQALEAAEKARLEAEARAAATAAAEAEREKERQEAARLREAEAEKERAAVRDAQAAVRAEEESRRRAVEVVSAREVELKARIAAAERAKADAEREREQRLREADLARRAAEVEADALAARRKAEEDAAQAQREAAAAQERLRRELGRVEKEAKAADQRATALEAKAAAGQREVDAARGRLGELRTRGAEARKLGVKVQAVSAQLAATLGLDRASGAFVAKTEAGGEGERLGLRANDIIVTVNGAEIAGPKEFVGAVGTLSQADALRLEIVRAGKRLQLVAESDLGQAIAREAKTTAELEKRHQPSVEAATRARAEADQHNAALAEIRARLRDGGAAEPRRIGVNVEALSPQVSAALGLREGQGAFVVAVQEGGDADRGGVRQNDVVLAVNGASVAGPEQFKLLVGRAMHYETIALEVLRQGARVKLTVPPGKAAPASRPALSDSSPPPAERASRPPPDPRALDLGAAVEAASEGEASRAPVKSSR